MQYEHVFTVKGSTAVPLAKAQLSDAGFLERQHLQEWLVNNPEVLGDDVMIVAIEFDRWQSFSGDAKRDRLDILAIDSSGRLLIAELKRGQATSHVDLQSLKYAAAVSRFDPETLTQTYQRFLKTRTEKEVTFEEAQQRLEDHIDGPLEQESWLQPRISLIAHGFDESVTNTVVWLSEAGLDIALLRYQLYSTGADPLFVISQMYPTPETEEFILAPRREEVEQTKAKTKTEQRQKDAVKILAAENALETGTPLHLEPSGINEDLREEFKKWLSDDPSRAEGSWTGDVSAPIEWALSQTRGKPSTFATQALEKATGIRRSLNGSQWWYLDDGRSLGNVAAEYIDAKRATRDWSDLHQILNRIPRGRWTTYGDLAAAVGTAPQPLGQHLQNCPDCENPAQVLRTDGTSSPGFTWDDPTDVRSQQQYLIEEHGIRFDSRGAADSSSKLSTAQLKEFSEQSG